ncbi:Clp1/GlmU family protein [Kaarinaea lacus]
MATPRSMDNTLPVLLNSAAAIIEHTLPRYQRILLFGPPGSGKSTLATALARQLEIIQRQCYCISADPGSPGFGLPGAVSLGKWQSGIWQIEEVEAICSLDAGRFRLPLIAAVRHLTPPDTADSVLLVDGPGVVRGVAGRELLTGLAEAAGIDLVLIMVAPGQTVPLIHELRSLAIDLCLISPVAEAVRPGKRARARRRTLFWDTYLQTAEAQQVELVTLNLLGIPPPLDETTAWVGRQVALQRGQRTVAMGEVLALNDDIITLKAPVAEVDVDSLLIRDAWRNENGLVETAAPFSAARFDFMPPPEGYPSIEESGGPRVVGRVGTLDVTLVNGVFGDPLLHLRIRHKGRSLLFDLGEGGRLSARLAHQVTDVFVSHAHIDHIGGFQWLLRSRLGEYPPCRLYGPPGLARHIEGFMLSFLWDRVADRGPCFEVYELHGEILRGFRLQAGYPGIQQLEAVTITDGILLKEAGFQVRAVQLDHHTAVLAYAFEPDMEIHIRKDRLLARGLEPGPWLTALKQAVLSKTDAALIDLPDGTQATAGSLQQDLTLIAPGKKLVYATDLADTLQNRERLVAFARHAHTFFCEATFLQADVDHAERNGHLTTRACGEIATAARVGRLVSFHFSRRYAECPDDIYEELKAACDRVVIPQTMSIFDTNIASETETRHKSELKI